MPRRLVFSVAIAAGIGIGLGVGFAHRPQAPQAAVAVAESSIPDASWPAGAKPAPGFALHDQAGRPVSLARFRGRPVIVTFMDPVCGDLCPTEARILARALAGLPAGQRPPIVSVSVNRWANAPRILVGAERKWRVPAGWRWAIGSPAALKKVWDAYKIGVYDAPKTVHGVVEHEITHTEAAYVIDARGDIRALFLYPFQSATVASVIRSLGDG